MAGRDGRMRAGHADRERVIGVLKAAFVQGRLDAGELDARVGAAFAARTYGELAALTSDIPASTAAAAVADAGPIAADGPVADVAKPGPTPRQTLAKASRRAGVCMLVTISLVFLCFLTQQFDLMIPAVFAFIGAYTFLGYGVVDAVQQRRSRGRLPSRPDRSGRGLDGGPELDGGLGLGGGRWLGGGRPGEPGARVERTGADLRACRPRKAGSRRGRPVYA
jgi:Domain of unknown function (DUF1707)